MPTKYRRQENIVARSVAGTNLLVPVHACTNSVYTLNDTGHFLWQRMDAPRTADELAAVLVEHYVVTLETAREAVESFLDDMLRMNLVVREGAESEVYGKSPMVTA